MKKFQRVLNVVLSLAIVLGSCLIVPKVSVDAAGSVDGTVNGSDIVITLDYNINGIENKVTTYTSGALIEAWPVGYLVSGQTLKLQGWYEDTDFTVPADLTTATATKTYYAKWVPNAGSESFSNYNFKVDTTKTYSAVLSAKIHNGKSLFDLLEEADNDSGTKSIWIGDTLNAIDTNTYSSYTISAKTVADVIYLTATDDGAMEGAIKTLIEYMNSVGTFKPEFHVTQKYYPGAGDYSYTWGDEFTEFNRYIWGDYSDIKAVDTKLAPDNTVLVDGYRSLRTSGVEVVGGNLVLKTGVELQNGEPEYFYGRQIATRTQNNDEAPRLKYRYGMMEIRAKVPKTPASADFWFTGDGFEADLFEAIEEFEGVDNNHVFATNLHTNTTAVKDEWVSLDTKGSNNYNNLKEAKRYRSGSVDLSADFHLYSFYWTDSEIRYCVDGVDFVTFDFNTGKLIDKNGNQYQSLITSAKAKEYFQKEVTNFIITATMNCAGESTGDIRQYGPQWVSGDVTETQLELDYIRLYQRKGDANVTLAVNPRSDVSIQLEDEKHNEFLGIGADDPIVTDVNGDGVVDVRDFLTFRNQKYNKAASAEPNFDYDGSGEVSYDDLSILRKTMLGKTYSKSSYIDPLYHIDFEKSNKNTGNSWTAFGSVGASNSAYEIADDTNSSINNGDSVLKVAAQSNYAANQGSCRSMAFYSRTMYNNNNYLILEPGNYIIEYDYNKSSYPTGHTSGTAYAQFSAIKNTKTWPEISIDNARNAKALSNDSIVPDLNTPGDDIWHHRSISFSIAEGTDVANRSLIGIWIANIRYSFKLDNIKIYKVAGNSEYTNVYNGDVDGVKVGSSYYGMDDDKIRLTIPNTPQNYKGEPRTLPFNDGTKWLELTPGTTYKISYLYKYDRTSYASDGATFNNNQANDIANGGYDWAKGWYVELVYNFPKVYPFGMTNPRWPDESVTEDWMADFGLRLVRLLDGKDSDNLNDNLWQHGEATFTLPADAETGYVGIRVNHATAKFNFSSIDISTAIPATQATFKYSDKTTNGTITNNQVTLPEPQLEANIVQWQLDGTDEIYNCGDVVDLNGKPGTTFTAIYGLAEFDMSTAANYYGSSNMLGGSAASRHSIYNGVAPYEDFITLSSRSSSLGYRQFIFNKNFTTNDKHMIASYNKGETYRVTFDYKYDNRNSASQDAQLYLAFGIGRNTAYSMYATSAISKIKLDPIESTESDQWYTAEYIVTAPNTYTYTRDGVDYLAPYVGMGIDAAGPNGGEAEVMIDNVTITPVPAPKIVDAVVGENANSFRVVAGYTYGDTTAKFPISGTTAAYDIVKRGIIFGGADATKDELTHQFGSYINRVEVDSSTALYADDTANKIAKYAVNINDMADEYLSTKFAVLPYVVVRVGTKDVTIYGNVSRISYNDIAGIVVED